MSLLFNFCDPASSFPLGIISIVIQLLGIAILIRALMSWFVRDPYNPIAQALDRVTEPILQPLRRVIPRMGMMDITPLVAIIVLSLIARGLCT